MVAISENFKHIFQKIYVVNGIERVGDYLICVNLLLGKMAKKPSKNKENND